MASGTVFVDQTRKNNFSSGISLDSYTSSFYTIPSDGYILAQCSSAVNAKAIVRVYGADNDTYSIQIGGWGNSTYATYATFVRKGMRAKVVTLENSGHVTFVPIS